MKNKIKVITDYQYYEFRQGNAFLYNYDIFIFRYKDMVNE